MNACMVQQIKLCGKCETFSDIPLKSIFAPPKRPCKISSARHTSQHRAPGDATVARQDERIHTACNQSTW